MKTNRVLAVILILAGMMLALQAPVRMLAQDQPAADQGQPQAEQAPDQDPPGRAARLSYSVGSVSFQPGGQGDWVQAVVNRPLTTGDNLWADKDSRGEFQIGSTSVRIDSETSVTFLELDDRTTQLRLSQGSLIVRVRHLDDEDHFEIDTPNSAFEIQRTGEYRVDVKDNGNETDTTVWRGRGEVTGGGSSYVVVAGQRARFTGSDDLDHEIGQIPGSDDFDEFAFQRDKREDRAESANYISTEVTGYEDLDEYGRWHYVADYGPVWTPVRVVPGWAPYRFGHWVWIAPWGWTWVEDEPWGFAPFHYGRWAYVGGGWCWVPGPVVVRPVYAPALVVFVGAGPHVGWFPLAPREVYVPWYRTSRGYVNNVNITNTRVNVTNITNVYNTNTTNVTRVTYVNQRVTNGVTVVSRDTFVGGRPIARNLARVDAREIAEAPVTRTVAVQPIRQSVLGAGRPAAARPSATIVNRQVVATRVPSARGNTFEQPQPITNIRTETPRTPQPAVRTDNQPARPPVSPRLETQGPTSRPEQPTAGNRGERPRNVPRPEPPRVGVTHPQEPLRGQEPSPTQARPAPRPPAFENGRPMVRPAPPVQERPERQQSEERKFQTWERQRQSASEPRPVPRTSERAPQPQRQSAPEPRSAPKTSERAPQQHHDDKPHK